MMPLVTVIVFDPLSTVKDPVAPFPAESDAPEISPLDVIGPAVVLTPAKIYDTCLMLSMTDITGGETKQDQVAFQIDFIQPLISQTSLANALSSLMSKVTNGQPTTGSLAGNIGSTLGMPSMPSAPSIPGLSSFIPGIPS